MNRWLCSLLVAVTLAACGSSTTTPAWFVRDYQGLPPGYTLTPPQALVDTAVWNAAGQVAVVSFGSSSCPKLPVHLETSAGNALTITLSSGAALAGGACTADYAATTTLIWVPDTVDQTQTMKITIIDGADRHSAVLPPFG